MIRQPVKDGKVTRIVDQHRVVLACSDQLCAIVRELAVPDFIRVLGEVGADLQRKFISVTHVIRVERWRISGVVIQAIVDLALLHMV